MRITINHNDIDFHSVCISPREGVDDNRPQPANMMNASPHDFIRRLELLRQRGHVEEPCGEGGAAASGGALRGAGQLQAGQASGPARLRHVEQLAETLAADHRPWRAGLRRREHVGGRLQPRTSIGIGNRRPTRPPATSVPSPIPTDCVSIASDHMRMVVSISRLRGRRAGISEGERRAALKDSIAPAGRAHPTQGRSGQRGEEG